MLRYQWAARSCGPKLPNSAVATLYVRTVDAGGSPSQDTYTVCFFVNENLGLNPPTIYRFVGGAWVAVAIGNPDAGVICAVESGEGAYCLGEPSKKKTDG